MSIRQDTKMARAYHIGRFISNRRKSRPLPTYDELSPIEKQQCEVIQCQLESYKRGFPYPSLFTSSAAGLVAIQQRYGHLPETLFLMYQDEYEEFSREQGYRIVCSGYYHFWNYFKNWTGQGHEENKKKRAQSSLRIAEDSRLGRHIKASDNLFDDLTNQGYTVCKQHIGRSSGPMSGEGRSYIWRWDGQELVHVEESMSWVS